MANQLSPQQIADLLAGVGKRGGTKDTTEPRTFENWFKQDLIFVHRKDNPELKCMNDLCLDPRAEDAVIVLIHIKNRLMCRFCFLDGYMSGLKGNEE